MPMISSTDLLVDRDARSGPRSTIVSIASSIVASAVQRDHRDARDHDLVDALVAELDDRVDHLLLLGLEDALLAALLDDQAQLLGADPLVGRDVGAEQAADPAGDRRERTDQRAEAASRGPPSSRDVESATRSAWASPICFGTSSPNTIVNSVSRIVTTTSAMPSAAFASGPNWRSTSAAPSTRLTAANAEARKPRKLMPIWMTARNRPGFALRRWTRTAARVALVDQLLDPAAAERDEGDLRRREDPVEQDEDDDEAELEAGRRSRGIVTGSGFRRLLGRFRAWLADPGRARRPRACPAGRPSSRPRRRRSGRPRRSRAGRRSSCRRR